MITTVNWQYILLDGSAANGYRVKRRIGGSQPPIINGGTDMPMSDNWVSAPAPNTIHYVPDGHDYILAFWSLNAVDVLSSQRSAQIQTANVANDSHSGGMWTISAKAFYVWNFGVGNGDNAVLIDAFDIQAGDFIPDDFVDVTPGALTADANNGYIDTSTQIVAGNPIKISARDALPAKQFAYWQNIAAVMYSDDPKAPATVGAPDKHDIVAHVNDVVVAFAFYNEVPRSWVIPRDSFYNPWWWIETRGGLVPPGPPQPWMREFAAALVLAETAGGLSSKVQAGVLKLVLEQLKITSASIKNDIEKLGRQ
jgi:hypothetical protein